MFSLFVVDKIKTNILNCRKKELYKIFRKKLPRVRIMSC